MLKTLKIFKKIRQRWIPENSYFSWLLDITMSSFSSFIRPSSTLVLVHLNILSTEKVNYHASLLVGVLSFRILSSALLVLILQLFLIHIISCSMSIFLCLWFTLCSVMVLTLFICVGINRKKIKNTIEIYARS